jgi:23S rRNA pseudouridine2605 synthase
MNKNEQPTEKLQKILARRGLGSRREMEQVIEEGRVKVNGRRATLGDRACLTDKIAINGRIVKLNQSNATQVLIYHKPAGKICTRKDPEGRPTVFAKLPKLDKGRWVSVGRLDISTSGLLLFTNNGELANRLMHPSSEVEREYAVRVLGEVTEPMLDTLRTGVEIDDSIAKFDRITNAGGSGANHWYHVILREGRNREVRRLWESQGVTVSRLIRVRFGCVKLDRSVMAGTWRYAPSALVQRLQELAKPKT